MNNKRSRHLCLLLAFCLLAGAACPGARAAEISQTEPLVTETVSTVPTEPQVTEPTAATEPETLPAETEPIPETTEASLPAATVVTLPPETSVPETEETVPTSESELPTEEDEWLFTLTDTPAPVEDMEQLPPAPPEETLVSRLMTNWESLLAALVFALFGIGTCWFGGKLGGTKFLLRLYGIRTEGTISRIEWDAWHRARQCFVSYRLENGRMVEVRWPVLQHIVQVEKLRGKACTVYYNPRNPKVFYCSAFPMGSLLGTLTVAVGMLLLVAAAAVVICVLFI